MCKMCVEMGDMSQAELDLFTDLGDKSVIPMIDLPLADFLEQVAIAAGKAVAQGAQEEVVEFVIGCVAAYAGKHPEITKDELDTAYATVVAKMSGDA